MRLDCTTAALAVLASCFLTDAASAHAHLKSAIPPMDGTVTKAPSELNLTFSEGVNPRFSGVSVTAANGSKIRTGEAQLEPNSDTTMRITLPDRLPPGHYKVEWRALATDGHKTSGSFGFSVEP